MENKEVVELIRQFQEKYEVQERYIEELRGIKHDIQAHMIVLKYYLQEEKWEKAKEYLDAILEAQGQVVADGIDTGNKMVDAIISYRVKRCECPIDVQIDGGFTDTMTITEYDLCTIFSNLISNAVEACERLTLSNGYIYCGIKSQDNDLSLHIQNPIEGEIDVHILGNGTTKEDKNMHGYGIKNVRRIVEKYKGEIKYDLSNGLISVKVHLPSIV